MASFSSSISGMCNVDTLTAVSTPHSVVLLEQVGDVAALQLQQADVLILAVPRAPGAIKRAWVVVFDRQVLQSLSLHVPALLLQPLLALRHRPAVEVQFLVLGDVIKDVGVVLGIKAVLLNGGLVGGVVGVDSPILAQGAVLEHLWLCW